MLGPTGVDERFAATLAFPGQVLGLFDSGFDLVPRSELEALGSAGSIRAEDPWEGLTPRLTLRRGEHVEAIEFDPVDHYRLELEDLDRAIRGEGALLGRADALGQARTIAALVRAAELGRAVSPA